MREGSLGVADWETERLSGFTALTARRGQLSNLRCYLDIVDSSGKKLCHAEFERESGRSNVVARGTLKVAGQTDMSELCSTFQFHFLHEWPLHSEKYAGL